MGEGAKLALGMNEEKKLRQITGYSPAEKERIIGEIVDKLAKGGAMAAILRDGENMPNIQTVWEWMNANPETGRRITQAREDGGDHIANECLAIADEKPADMVAVQHQKLRVETRLKLLSKWHPKRYGDKLELSGEITVTESPLAQLRTLVKTRQTSQPSTLEMEIVDMGETGADHCF